MRLIPELVDLKPDTLTAHNHRGQIVFCSPLRDGVATRSVPAAITAHHLGLWRNGKQLYWLEMPPPATALPGDAFGLTPEG